MSGEHAQAERNPFERLQSAWEEQNVRTRVGMRCVTERKQACFEMWKGAPKVKFRIVSVETANVWACGPSITQPADPQPFCLVRLGRGMKSERESEVVCLRDCM